jgi:hypothetical protein
VTSAVLPSSFLDMGFSCFELGFDAARVQSFEPPST